jgi:hypothetical protein
MMQWGGTGECLVEGVDEGDGSSGRGNKFRLEGLGKAMSGSCIWDPPGGLLNDGYLPLFPPRFTLTTSFHIAGLDQASLPAGSTIVDIGGGIGSMSM